MKKNIKKGTIVYLIHPYYLEEDESKTFYYNENPITKHRIVKYDPNDKLRNYLIDDSQCFGWYNEASLYLTLKDAKKAYYEEINEEIVRLEKEKQLYINMILSMAYCEPELEEKTEDKEPNK